MKWEFIPPGDVSQLASRLNEQLTAHLDLFPERDRQQYAERLSEARAGSGEQATLITANVTSAYARRLSEESKDPDEVLRYCNIAAELYRGLSAERYAASLRRSVLGFFEVSIGSHAGNQSAESLIAEVTDILNRVYGKVPTDLELAVNAAIIDGYEERRRLSAEDPGLLKSLISENFEAIMGLKIPVDREGIKQAWREDCAHYVQHLYQIFGSSAEFVGPFWFG
jgi:hypothetical protein